jgi:hypothetical protein
VSDPLDHELTPDRGETERLSLAWNALVRGETGAIEALDAGDAAVIRRLGAMAPGERPRRAFVDQLKEYLMDATVSVPAAGPARAEPLLAIVQPEAVVPTQGRWWWEESRRGLSAVATVALVVVTMLGGYLAISSYGPGSGERRGTIMDRADGSPTPDAFTEHFPSCINYGPFCPIVEPLGRGFVYKPDLDAADLAASNVQLQDWSVDPGARIELAGDVTSGVHGAVVDVVLEGAYVVTVDGPAVVTRRRLAMQGNVEYLSPGTVAELAQGDTISYPAGRARTIVNPLMTVPLHFKSAVFYNGDVALTRPPDPQPAGLRVQANGDGVLPRPLADYPSNELNVELDYIQVWQGSALPDVRSGQQRIIGPVDPVQPEIEEGYVLWAGEPRG